MCILPQQRNMSINIQAGFVGHLQTGAVLPPIAVSKMISHTQIGNKTQQWHPAVNVPAARVLVWLAFALHSCSETFFPFIERGSLAGEKRHGLWSQVDSRLTFSVLFADCAVCWLCCMRAVLSFSLSLIFLTCKTGMLQQCPPRKSVNYCL